jgi:hypothetical protein
VNQASIKFEQSPGLMTATLHITEGGQHGEMFLGSMALGVIETDPDIAGVWAEMLGTWLKRRMAEKGIQAISASVDGPRIGTA